MFRYGRKQAVSERRSLRKRTFSRSGIRIATIIFGAAVAVVSGILALHGVQKALAAPSSLVAAYAFDEGSGTAVTDASGNGNNGTVSNTTWSTSGKYGGALKFNGSSSVVTIPNAASLQLTTGMTLEAWVNPSAVSSAWRDVVYKGNDNFYLSATSSNASLPDAGLIAGGTYGDAYGTAKLTANTWAFLTETYDGSTVRLYVNGTQVRSTAHTGAIATSTNPLQIGGDSIYGQFFAGLIDNVRVYNVALTAAQIQADQATAVTTGPDTTPPTAPTGLKPTVVSSSEIDLSWTASTDPDSPVSGYQVWRCQGANCTNFTQVATPTSTSYKDTGLGANTTYTYEVRASDPSGNLSPYSNTAGATTLDTTPPTAPSGLTPTVVSGSEVDLSWTASTDPDSAVSGYQVWRCQGTSCTNFAQVGTSTGTSYKDTSLGSATTYTYEVRATDPSGNLSPYSSPVGATTLDTTPPTAPTALTPTVVSGSEIDLTWTASTDADSPVSGYQVWRCQGTSCTNFTQLATSTATSYKDTGLSSGTSYTYEVRASDPSGNLSLYSNTATASTPTPDTTPPTVPAGLTPSVVSGTAINLSWAASTDPDSPVAGYDIERCQGANCTNFTQVGTSTSTSFQDTGLSPSTSYSYRVRAYDPTGNLSGYSSVVSATTLDTTPPTTPTGLTPTVASGSEIDLSWTASTDPDSPVSGYHVWRCQGAGCTNFTQVGTSTATSYQDTGLSSATTYTYEVRASDPSGNLSPYSNTAGATTLDTTPPTAPSGLTPTVASGSEIDLAWTASTDPDSPVSGYQVWRCQGAGCTNFAQVGTSTGTSYKDTGLSSGTTYTYEVSASDPSGNLSPYSSTATAGTPTPDTTPPTAPSGLTPSVVSGSAINLSWTASSDPDSPVAGYDIERCQGASCTNFTQIGTSTSTSFQDAGLSAGTSYSYQVRAYDPSGNLSGYSSVVSATTTAPDTTPPTAPTGLTPTVVSGSEIDLSWTASTDPDSPVSGYQVWRCQGAGCTNFTQVAAPTGTSYNDTGLSANTTYTYEVGASDPSGNIGPFSNTVGATTLDTTPPTAPSGLTPTVVSTSEIDLAWTASTDPDSAVSGYQVWRCQGTGCTSFTQVAAPTGTSYKDTGLSANATYTYEVRASDPSGNISSFSNTAGTTTLDTTPPTAPTGLTPTVVSGSEIDLAWTASTDPDSSVSGYQVWRCQGTGCTNFTQVASTNSTSYKDTGLGTNATYTYEVRASDPSGNLSPYSKTAGATTLDTTPPTAPTGLTPAVVSGSEIDLSWTASTDPDSPVSGYQVWRCQGASCSNFTQVVTSTATSYQDTGLSSATTYTYEVRASDPTGNLGPYSNTAGATTLDTTPPTTPSALSATVVSSSEVDLGWGASTDNVGVTGYTVERCQGAGCSNFAQIASVSGTSTSYKDTGVSASASYSYRVRAKDAAGNLSPYSTTATATTPAAPSGLVAAYGFDEGSGTTVADASGNGHYGTITNATWATAGKYGKALQFNGTNALVTIPDAASLHLSSGMTLEAWVNPSTVNSIWRDVIYKGDDNFYLSATSSSASRPDAGLIAGGTYADAFGASALPVNTWSYLTETYDRSAVRLYVNGTQVASTAHTGTIATSTNPLQIGGDSFYGQYFSGLIDEVRVYSRALTATQIQADETTSVNPQGPPDTTPPSQPGTLTATPVSAGEVDLSWGASTDNVGVTAYLVERCQGAGCTNFTQIGVAAGNSPAYKDTSASSATSYTYRVRATDAAGNLGPYSNTAAVSTPTSLVIQYSGTSGGIASYNFTSSDDGYGTHVLRVLAPTNPAPGVPHNFLYALPVEPEQGTTYGDGLQTLASFDAEDKYNLTIVEPGFAYDPWYADNPNDPNLHYESFVTNELAPWVTQNLTPAPGSQPFAPPTGGGQNWLIGFSKSGIGGQDLLLKHPDVFAVAGSWDFPADMTAYDQFGSSSANQYGTDANFQTNYRLTSTFINGHKTPFLSKNRIWIGGYNTFQTDMTDYNALLTSQNVLHTTEPPTLMAHRWDSGWVPIAVSALSQEGAALAGP